MFKIIKCSVATIIAASFFLGCGGDEPVASVPFLPDAIEADATLSTGEILAQSLVTSMTATSGINSVDQQAAKINTSEVSSMVLASVSKQVQVADLSSSLNAAVDVSGTQSCTVSGTTTVSGTVDDITNAINATISFNSCDQGVGFVVHGSVAFAQTLDANSDGTTSLRFPSNYTMTFADSSYITIYAGTSISATIAGTQTDMVQTIKLNANGALFGSLNTNWIFTASEAYQKTGREYLNNLTSYIDYDTSYDMSATPFVDDGAGGVASGRTRYVFSNGARIQLTVANNSVLVEVDADANGTYELSSTIAI